MKILYALFIIIIAAGCQLTKDVTRNPGARTDFVAGETYQIMRPVFLWKSNKLDSKETPMLAEIGFGGTSSNLAEFRRDQADAPQVVGLLSPGEKARVTKFVEHKVPGLGTYFDVYAMIVSGVYDGTLVKLNLISKEARPTSKAFRDPRYLEPVK